MNMEIIGPILLSLIAGLSTLIGCLFIFIKVKNENNFIVYSLSFSMSIMILLSIFDLIPESLKTILNNYNKVGYIISILTFSLGYQTVYFLNKISKIEESRSLYRVGVLSLISLILHNIPEGIAVFLSSYKNIKLGIKLCIGIILHNIPEGIILSVPLFYSGKSRGQVLKYTMFASLSEPLGAIISYIFLKHFITDNILSLTLLFVSGLMISISINEILKETISYKKYKIMYSGILSAIIIFFLISLI